MKKDAKNIIHFMTLVDNRQMKAKNAARLLGYSEVHFCNLRKKYRKMGDKIFTHGLTGKRGNRATPPNIVRKIQKVYCRDYRDENFTIFHEEFTADYGVRISLATVSRILKRGGFVSPQSTRRKKRNPHKVRPRREHEGELVQMDATPYQWLKRWGNSEYRTLHGAIDDATGKILALSLAEHECSYGYFSLVKQIAEKHGLPAAIYTDKSGIFTKNPRKDMTVAEQIEWEEKKDETPTQWGRMCAELGIRHVLANSPQAKGRAERMWRTVQGRLPHWTRRNRIRTFDELKARLGEFVEYFNSRFAVKRKSAAAYLIPRYGWENCVCVKLPRKVLNGGIVKFEGLRIRTHLRPGERCNLVITEDGLFTDGFRGVEILDDYFNLSESAPQCLQKIVGDFLFKDAKECLAAA